GVVSRNRTATTVSLGLTPATSAGEPGTTASTTVSTWYARPRPLTATGADADAGGPGADRDAAAHVRGEGAGCRRGPGRAGGEEGEADRLGGRLLIEPTGQVER